VRWSPLVVGPVVLAVAAAGGVAYVVADHDDATPRPAPLVVSTPRPPVLTELPRTSPASSTAVTAALRRATRDVAFGGSLVGIVVDHATGRTVFTRRPDTSLPPASTVKILTAVTALDALGPQTRLTTGVVRLAHTLYLVGGGDMTLTERPGRGYPATATLRRLAADTASAVQASIPGRPVRVRYDDTAWSGADLAPGWSTGYFTAGDVSHLSPLEVDGGRVDHGEPLRVADPSAQAASLFAAELESRGLDVRGRPRRAAAPAAGLGIATVPSPPLAALVQRMLTVSDNDLAESLGRQLARREGLPATFAGAADAVRSRLTDLGIPVAGLRLHDASGLSHLDRVAPRTLVAAVRVAATGGGRLESVVQGLPVAGLTGTLADRYRHGPARAAAGVVRAKTGTLAGVSALAGQLVDADGRLLDFAFLTDRAALPEPAEAGLDRLAAALAACHCSSSP
jgi:D-alanyl-D-alanine carboxypeptidase/D-alanyl-D-alanine-endopeptidase (penicillin-binding protein 4)